MKESSNAAPSEEVQKESTKAKVKDQPSPSPDGEAEGPVGPESATDDAAAAPSDSPTKETKKDQEKCNSELAKASPPSPAPRESQMKEEKKQPVSVEDSDSERELVIDLGEEQGGRDKKRGRRDHTTMKESSAGKAESEICLAFFAHCWCPRI